MTHVSLPPEYERALTARLAALLRLWSSARFQRIFIDTTTHDLVETDAHVVWELAFRGPTRPGVLAADMSLGAPALTKAIGRLAARDIVLVRDDPADRRARLAELTDRGRDVAKDLFHEGDLMVDEVTREWAPEDLEVLVGLLDRLQRGTQEFADARRG